MNAVIKIPKGFSPVRSEFLKPTDRIVDVGNYWDEMKWVPAKDWEAFKAGDRSTSHYPLAIRRVSRPRKWVPAGFVEITATKFYDAFDEGLNDSMRFSPLKGRKLMTYEEWMCDGSTTAQTMETTRFFLRKGAK